MATRSALPEAMMFSAALRLQIRPTTATGMREPTARLIAAARSAFQPSGTLAGGNDVFHGLTDADGDVQHVHAVVGHDLGDADGLFHVDAAGHEFFHAVAEKDGEIGADLFF